MRDERLSQYEWSDVVRRECIVPAQRVLRRAHRENPGVVKQTHNWQIERDDLRCGTPHARKIRQITHDRHSAPSLLFKSLLQLAELFRIASDQYDRTVLRHLKCGRAANAGRRSGDDGCLMLGWFVHERGTSHSRNSFVVCLDSLYQGPKNQLNIRHRASKPTL